MSSDLALVHHADSNAEAQIVKGFLVSEGFAAVVPGSELVDEFASAARAMGTLGVQVLVPESELERAKEAVEAWKAMKPSDAEDADSPPA